MVQPIATTACSTAVAGAADLTALPRAARSRIKLRITGPGRIRLKVSCLEEVEDRGDHARCVEQQEQKDRGWDGTGLHVHYTGLHVHYRESKRESLAYSAQI